MTPTKRLTLEKLVVTGLAVVASLAIFVAVDSFNASRTNLASQLTALGTSFDTKIPFVPAFVFAYVFYFPWLLLPVFVLHERTDFYRAVRALALVQLVANVIFLAFPSQMIRPVFVSSGLAGSMLHSIYQVDAGWNAFPSLHVAQSLLIAEVVRVHRRDLFPFVACVTVLIVASTVLIKQHYLLDIPAGALLAWTCARLVGVTPPFHSAKAARASATAVFEPAQPRRGSAQ